MRRRRAILLPYRVQWPLEEEPMRKLVSALRVGVRVGVGVGALVLWTACSSDSPPPAGSAGTGDDGGGGTTGPAAEAGTTGPDAALPRADGGGGTDATGANDAAPT